MRTSSSQKKTTTARLFFAAAAAIAPLSALHCVEGGGEGAPSASARPAALAGAHAPTLTVQASGTTRSLMAISPVDAHVVWASGVGGTFLRTTDGGATWQARVVPGAEALQFRDVQGVSDRVAYLLSAGVGTDSRIYKTEDGGETWALQFQNEDPAGFYDCFAFWSPERGVVMADSVDGRFPALATADGASWQDIGAALPPALPGEAAFAASGTCAATQGKKRAWFVTAGAAKARVLATKNGGTSWAAYETPIVQGTPSSGIASVAFRDRRHGILGGGDLAAPAELSNNVARSRDGGKTWQLAAGSPFPGAIYGLSYALGRPADELAGDERDDGADELAGDERDDGADEREGDGERGGCATVVATGPGGAAWSTDEGDSWHRLEGVDGYWAVAFADERTGWLVGTGGRLLKIEL
ncbi:MAG TPA: hypothetical protein VFS43_41545 [Polyangiaceae bacterium]|nr:hypothetical protein [Polyangiaceae bacterium]